MLTFPLVLRFTSITVVGPLKFAGALQSALAVSDIGFSKTAKSIRSLGVLWETSLRNWL